MDRTITAREANQRFSAMLRQVQQGDSFTILSRGRPVARIEPAGRDLTGQAEKVKALLQRWESSPRRQLSAWTREDLYD